MNAEIERLFAIAVDLSPNEREDYLSQNCPDVAIRNELDDLLRHDHGSETFLNRSLSNAAASMLQSLTLSPGQRLGYYRILSVIGHGGMGVVYRGERDDGKFAQRVAIKVVSGSLNTPAFVERFQQEYRILASLEHPNIARLLDAGGTEDGLPYFVMEYVEGRPIDQFCAEGKLTLSERLQLLLPVCDAVQLAHQKLIVHRDLKPDNILVTEQGTPKLLDFGIARVLSDVPGGNEATLVAMTPDYASPEQIRGEPISTATDVYSLGGVLYRLLTGVAPHRLEGKSPAEVVRSICEKELPQPSSLNRELGKDEDNIVQMAMRKETERRYQSVEQFASDIRRLLNGQPVLASPDTVWYRTHKFGRRHWLGVAAFAAVLVALGAGVGVATWQARRAQRRFEQVRHLSNAFLFDFEQSIHQVPGTTKARQLLVKTALEYLQGLSRDAAGDPGLTRELAAAYEKVGDIQGDPTGGNVGNSADAVASYKQAVSLRSSLNDTKSADPSLRLDFIKALGKLAAVQLRTGDVEGAFQNAQQAVVLSEGLVEARAGDRLTTNQLASDYIGLGMVEMRMNREPAAQEHCQRALALLEPLAAVAPDDRNIQKSLALAYWRMGSLLEQTDKQPESIPYFEKAVASWEKLCAEEPNDASARRRLMISLADLGLMQITATFHTLRQTVPSNSDNRLAIQRLRRATAIADQAVAADPANIEAVSDLTAISVRLGNALQSTKNYKEAIQVSEHSVRVASDLVEHDPGSKEDRLMLGQARSNLSRVLESAKDMEGALREAELADGIFTKLVNESPNDLKMVVSQIWGWWDYGNLLAEQHRWQEARRYYAMGLQVAEKLAPQHRSFAQAAEYFQKSDRDAEKALLQK
jgi:tetratricopeptide (TPR) repeat protein/predicted Ser/Thr protein kinase